jgi:hypothetical protein
MKPKTSPTIRHSARARMKPASITRPPVKRPVIEYIVADALTGEWVMRGLSRSEAREFANDSFGGVVLEVRRAK